jgi:hypothetical protein
MAKTSDVAAHVMGRQPLLSDANWVWFALL